MVVSERLTVCADVYVPAVGLKVGVAACCCGDVVVPPLFPLPQLLSVISRAPIIRMVLLMAIRSWCKRPRSGWNTLFARARSGPHPSTQPTRVATIAELRDTPSEQRREKIDRHPEGENRYV